MKIIRKLSRIMLEIDVNNGESSLPISILIVWADKIWAYSTVVNILLWNGYKQPGREANPSKCWREKAQLSLFKYAMDACVVAIDAVSLISSATAGTAVESVNVEADGEDTETVVP